MIRPGDLVLLYFTAICILVYLAQGGLGDD